jgi:hypothetical protein
MASQYTNKLPTPAFDVTVFPYVIAAPSGGSRTQTPGRFSQWSTTMDFPVGARTLPVLPFQPPFQSGAPFAPQYVGF